MFRIIPSLFLVALVSTQLGCLPLMVFSALTSEDDSYDYDEESSYRWSDDEEWTSRNDFVSSSSVQTSALVRGDIGDAQNMDTRSDAQIYCDCGRVSFYNEGERGRNAYMADVSIDGIPPRDLFINSSRTYRTQRYSDYGRWDEDSEWVSGITCSGEASEDFYDIEDNVDEVNIDAQPLQGEAAEEEAEEESSGDEDDIDSQDDLLVSPRDEHSLVTVSIPNNYQGQNQLVQYRFELTQAEIDMLEEDYNNCGW